MPGTPPTTSIHGAPRYTDTEVASFAAQVNGVSDRFDLTAARIDSGLASARPPAGIAGRWYFATDTLLLTRDSGSAWQDPPPNAHAVRHQDGGADPLTVREAMMATGALGMAKGAFSAYRNAAHAPVPGGVIQWDTERWDVSNWFDLPNFRYQPQVAGWYRLNWCVQAGGTMAADSHWRTSLRKNGTTEAVGQVGYQRGAVANINSMGTEIVQANGTTDAFDVIIDHPITGGQAIATGAAVSYFQGHMVGRS